MARVKPTSPVREQYLRRWIDRGGFFGGGGGGPADEAFPLPRARIALWILLGMITLLFSSILSAYIVRLGLGDWHPLTEPMVLWFNTACLILSSVAFQWAAGKARRGQLDRVRRGLWMGGAFGLFFIAGQLWAWQQLGALGYFVSSNPSSSFFYLITALHGLHLIGGLIAWGVTSLRAQRGEDVARVRLHVELCALYWHFLLAIWLALFGLMLFT